MKIDISDIINKGVGSINFKGEVVIPEELIKTTEIIRLENVICEGKIIDAYDFGYTLEAKLSGSMVLPCSVSLEEVDYKFYNKIPYGIRHVIGKVAGLFPEVRGFNFLVRRGEKLENSYIGVNRNFSEKMARKVLRKNYELKAIDVTKDVYNEFKDYSNIDKMQAIDINFWLMKDI